MARNRDDDDDLPPRRRRENMMSQRLRKARGEEVDETYNDDDDDDDDYIPRSLNRSSGDFYAPRSRSGDSGCSSAALILVIGGLAALLIVGFFISRGISGIGNIFSGPNLAPLTNSPTPVIRTGTAVIQRIQQLNRLQTTSYTVERVIDVAQGSSIPLVGDFFAGDRLLLIAHGTVEAGLDLSKLRPEDVIVSPDGNVVTVRLPPVEIFSKSLDNSKTRVYTRDRGFFAPDNPNLETQARQVAEAEILQAACEGGIMQRANEDSKRALEQFLSLLEFQEVQVVAAPNPTCAAPVPATPSP